MRNIRARQEGSFFTCGVNTVAIMVPFGNTLHQQVQPCSKKSSLLISVR